MVEGIKRTRNESDESYCAKKRKQYVNLFTTLPSLKTIASASIAIRLWSASGISEELKEILYRYVNDSTSKDDKYMLSCYEKFKARVLSNLDKIDLPKCLKRSIVDIIKPIGNQLLRCYDFTQRDQHWNSFFVLMKMRGSICWTNDGLIDPLRSFRELIDNEINFNDVNTLFNMACSYCSVELTSFLFNKIDEKSLGSSYYHLRSFLNYSKQSYSRHLIVYWTAVHQNTLNYVCAYILQNDFCHVYSDHLSFYGNMVSLSIFLCNTFALKYFWSLLTEQEQVDNLEDWLNKAIDYRSSCSEIHDFSGCPLNLKHGHIIFFLFSCIRDKSQKVEVFQRFCESITETLMCEWPLQRYFLPIFTEMLDYLSCNDYSNIMLYISESTEARKTNHDLLNEILYVSPVNLKEHFFGKFLTNQGLSTFLNMLSNKNIDTVLNLLWNLPRVERKLILFKMINQNSFQNVAFKEFSLVKQLSRKTLSPKDIKIFKNEVKLTYGKELCKDWIRLGYFDKAENFLNWAFSSQSRIQSFKNRTLNSIELLIAFVDSGDFEGANKFLNWYFVSEKEMGNLGRNFLRDENAVFYIRLLFSLSCLGETGWNMFEKIVNIGSYTINELSQLKILATFKIENIISSHNCEFATKLLSWCFKSSSEIIQFKEELMLSHEGIEMFVSWLQTTYQDWDKIQATLKWFSPISREVIAKLKFKLRKEKFSECERLSFFIEKDAAYIFLQLLDTCTF